MWTSPRFERSWALMPSSPGESCSRASRSWSPPTDQRCRRVPDVGAALVSTAASPTCSRCRKRSRARSPVGSSWDWPAARRASRSATRRMSRPIACMSSDGSGRSGGRSSTCGPPPVFIGRRLRAINVMHWRGPASPTHTSCSVPAVRCPRRRAARWPAKLRVARLCDRSRTGGSQRGQRADRCVSAPFDFEAADRKLRRAIELNPGLGDHPSVPGSPRSSSKAGSTKARRGARGARAS